MKKLLSLMLGTSLAVVSFSQTVFYGGDPTGADTSNYFATVNGIRSRMVTFDDFTWSVSTPLTGFFGEFISNQTFQWGHYEIRTGMSSGVAGLLVSAGDIAVTSVDQGQSNVTGNSSTFRRYFVEGTTSPIFLTQGQTYFVSFSIDYKGNSLGQGAILRTTGVNGVGSPIANGNLLHDQPSSGLNYSPRAGDVAYGLNTSAVPEPAAAAALSLGVASLFRRKRKASASV